ncbi:SET domain-containing protein [Mollisia scopiformis]|uniref:SET domain-containing protein n=1 Tax=Mollisia scopiformis TaxID=149040 RepID=A0A194WYI8_MOLSC|nr:SET domain-containing protein [Mollisia scopiformis]KUJ13031.1 SET domain-containing protein [Mollisia scopiformis]
MASQNAGSGAQVKRSIPARVQCSGSLEMKESSMYSGIGIYTAKDIEENELIFSIKNPVLAVITNVEDGYKTACDNCFAALFKELRTVTNPQLAFKACSACKIAHYCSKQCQKAAWKHHHKHECQTYATSDIGDIIYVAPIRLLVRMLCLYTSNTIPKDLWNEFLSLPSEKKYRIEESRNAIKEIAQFMSGVTNLPQSLVVETFSTVIHNQRDIYLPTLRLHSKTDPLATGTMGFMGDCIDPFASLIKHSCDGNTWLVFEGTELRCRAMRRIQAGTELTMSYIRPSTPSFIERREKLRQTWNIDCKCSLCQYPSPEPLGDLKKQLTRYNTHPKEGITFTNQQPTLDEIQKDIEQMKAAGFGAATLPMLALHRLALWAHLS